MRDGILDSQSAKKPGNIPRKRNRTKGYGKTTDNPSNLDHRQQISKAGFLNLPECLRAAYSPNLGIRDEDARRSRFHRRFRKIPSAVPADCSDRSRSNGNRPCRAKDSLSSS